MESLIRRLAGLTGLSEELTQDVMEAAREALAERLTPEQLAKADQLLADESQSQRVADLVAVLGRRAGVVPAEPPKPAPEEPEPPEAPTE